MHLELRGSPWLFYLLKIIGSDQVVTVNPKSSSLILYRSSQKESIANSIPKEPAWSSQRSFTSFPPKISLLPGNKQNSISKSANPKCISISISPSNLDLLTSNLIRGIPALQIRHPARLRTRHRPRNIRDLIPVAHSVIKELDAAPVRDRVQGIRRGNAVQVGAAAGASTTSVEFTRAIAGFCWVQVEGPLDVSWEKREGGCGCGKEECGGREGAENE